MFNLSFLIPIIFQLGGLKNHSFRIKLTFFIFSLLFVGSALFYGWNAVLLTIDFPTIKMAVGSSSNFFFYVFVAALLAFASFVTDKDLSIFYVLGFGLVGASGEPILLLTLAMAAKVESGEKFLPFIISATILIGQIVFATQSGFEVYHSSFNWIALFAFALLFLQRVLLPITNLNRILDIGLYALLITFYASEVGELKTVTSVLIAATMLVTFINLRFLKLGALTAPLIGLMTVLLIISKDLSSWHPFGCALFGILLVSDRKTLESKGHFKPPHSQLISICGFYLLIFLILVIIFKNNMWLGWSAIVGLQLTRKSISSIGAYIQKLDSDLVTYSALSLLMGLLLAMPIDLIGGLSW